MPGCPPRPSSVRQDRTRPGRPARRTRAFSSHRSARPAELIGETRTLEPGTVADLVVFDPAARWTIGADSLASASSNTPLLGMELPGVVRLTVADGRITYRDGLDPIP